MQILIGCDPEVFVSKAGLMCSAFGLIPGTKADPFKVDKGAVQVDGMALEFNIDPAHNEDEFCLNVNTVIHQLSLMVPDYKLAIQPVAHFTDQVMKEQPPEALELGCDPDYNAWTMAVNDKPNANRPMRTASGHIHIGWTDKQDVESGEAFARAGAVARQMDFFLGLGSLMYDNDTERRSMYGKAGCFRVKPYGMEYRTLSNAWLKDEVLTRWAYRNSVAGMKALQDGRVLTEKYGDISEIINNSDKKEAKKIIKAEGLEVING